MLMFKLPFPPSVNTYWRKWNNRMVLSEKGRQYKKDVVEIMSENIDWWSFKDDDRLKMVLDLYPGDKRKRDVDNYSKGVLDALCDAGLYSNDSQVKIKLTRFNEPSRPGHCIVTIGLTSEIFGITI